MDRSTLYDPHLREAHSDPTQFDFLRRQGLISRTGEILSKEQFRLHNAKADAEMKVKEDLADKITELIIEKRRAEEHQVCFMSLDYFIPWLIANMTGVSASRRTKTTGTHSRVKGTWKSSNCCQANCSAVLIFNPIFCTDCYRESNRYAIQNRYQESC